MELREGFKSIPAHDGARELFAAATNLGCPASLAAFAAASNVVDKLAYAVPEAPAALAENHVDYIITWPIAGFDPQSFPFLSKEFAEADVEIYKVHRN